jgi:hypothetical protein
VGSGWIWWDLVGSGGIRWDLVVESFDSTRSQKLVGSVVGSFDSTNFPNFPPVAVYRRKAVESTKFYCRAKSRCSRCLEAGLLLRRYSTLRWLATAKASSTRSFRQQAGRVLREQRVPCSGPLCWASPTSWERRSLVPTARLTLRVVLAVQVYCIERAAATARGSVNGAVLYQPCHCRLRGDEYDGVVPAQPSCRSAT